MDCLICSTQVADEVRFTDIFCLRNKNFSTCRDCKNRFEKITEQHCPQCYKEEQDNICNDCLQWQDKGESINHTAIYKYNEAMKHYFSQYKFQGDYLLRYVFGTEIKQNLKEYKNYVIVPIPISDKRLSERGFNQVTGFLEASKIPFQNLLLKKDGQKQSEKSREERLKIKNEFYVKEDVELPSRILIVDDIYTTGATIQNARRCLFEKGVKEIKSFSLAR